MDAGASRKFEQDLKTVARKFWPTLKKVARAVPFSQDLVAAYYCAFDRETPLHVRATLIGALVYFVAPIDAMPDFLPLIGFADDASILAAAIASVRMHMTDRHWEAARRALAEDDEATASV